MYDDPFNHKKKKDYELVLLILSSYCADEETGTETINNVLISTPAG